MAASVLKVTKYSPQATSPNLGACNVAIKEGALVGLDSSGNVVLASCTNAAIVRPIGFNPVGNKAINDQVAACTFGVIDGFTGLTIGAPVYLSGSADVATNGGPSGAGGYTATVPGTTGMLISIVGIAISATKVLVNIRNASQLA